MKDYCIQTFTNTPGDLSSLQKRRVPSERVSVMSRAPSCWVEQGGVTPKTPVLDAIKNAALLFILLATVLALFEALR